MLNPAASARLAAAIVGCLFASASDARIFVPDSDLDGADVQVGDGLCATSSGTCSLRAAIQEANALAGVDEIHLQPCIDLPCPIYRIDIDASGSDEDGAASGDLDVRDSLVIRRDPASARGLVHIAGHASSANPHDRVLDVDVPAGAAASEFSDLLIANGFYPDAEAEGAGLRVAAGSQLLLERVVFYANFGHGYGSALSTRGDVRIRDAFVFDNHQLRDGVATVGGGTLHVGAGGSLRLDNVVVDSNSSWRGGALFVEGAGTSADVRRAHFANGSNDPYEIVATAGATVTVGNATFSGGGPTFLLAGGARVDLVHVTLADETAGQALLDADDSGAVLTLANSAIEPVAGCTNPAGSLASLGGNVFAGAAPCALTVQDDDTIVAALGLVETLTPPPLEVMPGTWHRVMLPRADSPVIDAAASGYCLADDELGSPRPGPTPAARCDSGAIEWPLDAIFADGFDASAAGLVEWAERIALFIPRNRR